jgi:excisionase family DNA binding protein
MSKKPTPEGALYVRLPSAAIDKLDRAAEALGVRKKDLVAGLVTTYVDPDTPRGLTVLGEMSRPRPQSTVGSYSFKAYDPPEAPEVMSAAQAAQFLQIDEGTVVELAEAGTLPGRRLGTVWRFSRAALLEWLAGEQP